MRSPEGDPGQATSPRGACLEPGFEGATPDSLVESRARAWNRDRGLHIPTAHRGLAPLCASAD